MMDILIVSKGDTCRSRMARELLLSFGRGMTIQTAGVETGTVVPSEVSELMVAQGYGKLSERRPTPLADYKGKTFDVVITLCAEAKMELATASVNAGQVLHLEFDDPYSGHHLGTDTMMEHLESLYAVMYRMLYRLYRDTLSDMLMPACTCGANTYCRCE